VREYQSPGGHGDGYRADLEALGDIARKSGDLGDTLLPKARDTASESAAAVTGNDGLAIASALKQTQLTCEKNVEGFARWMDDMQDRLDAAIDHYKDTEKWSMDLLHGIGV